MWKKREEKKEEKEESLLNAYSGEVAMLFRIKPPP